MPGINQNFLRLERNSCGIHFAAHARNPQRRSGKTQAVHAVEFAQGVEHILQMQRCGNSYDPTGTNSRPSQPRFIHGTQSALIFNSLQHAQPTRLGQHMPSTKQT
jgi:hypothetical protein